MAPRGPMLVRRKTVSAKLNQSGMSSAPGLGLGRNLRACMVCSVILPTKDFIDQGCPNCEEVVQFKDSPEAVNDCTSSNFNGVIALTDPKNSWVAKWQRLDSYAPGHYAVQVNGQLPEDVTSELAARGIKYIPRDGSKEDEVAERDD